MAQTDSRGRTLLRRWMRAQGTTLTQNGLAKLLGISSGNMSRIVTGERCPGLGLALRLESVCGIPVAAWKESVRHAA